jgi:hypothetical protein
MTFKLKSGFAVGSTTVVDSNSYFQQTESSASILPSLALDFTNRTLDRRIVYSRSSNGSFFSTRGLIEWIGAGNPRYDHDPATRLCKGLLMEEPRTNRVTTINDWMNYHFLDNATIAPNMCLAPDGTWTGNRLTSTITGGTNTGLIQKIATVPLDNTPYTFSVFVKQGSSPKVTINCSLFGGTYTDILATLTWSTLAITTTGSLGSTIASSRLVPYPDGWYRFSTTILNNSTNTNAGIRIYTRDWDVNNVAGDSVFFWGAQHEAGYYPSTLIFPADTFTSRSSNATYQDNTDGIVKYAGPNVVRYNWNRTTRTNTTALFERQGVNLFLYSVDTTQSAWTKYNTTTTANTTSSPDSNVNASSLMETAVSNTHSMYQTITVSAGALQNPYTLSVYVKANGRTQIALTLQEWQTFTRNSGATFDITNLTDGRVVTSYASVAGVKMIDATIENVGSGWFRCSLSANLGSSDTLLTGIVSLISGGTSVYTGSVTSGIYVWGAQLEATEYRTSYIPTVASTATRTIDVFSSAQSTRSGDAATIPATTPPSWFNNSEGTVVIEFESMSAMTGIAVVYNKYPQPFNFGGNTSSTAVLWYGSVAENSTNNNYNNYGAVPFYTNIKLALAVANTGGQTTTVYNGGSVINFNGTTFTRDLYGIGIGCAPTGIFQLGGTVKNFSFFPKQLSNTQIINLTSS